MGLGNNATLCGLNKDRLMLVDNFYLLARDKNPTKKGSNSFEIGFFEIKPINTETRKCVDLPRKPSSNIYIYSHVSLKQIT